MTKIQPIEIRKAPRSKYLSNRWLVLAALSESPAVLNGVPDNEDIRHLVSGLQTLGVVVTKHENGLVLSKKPSVMPKEPVIVHCGDSGSMARFIMALAATKSFPVTVDGSQRLRSRPMAPLIRALEALGAKISSTNGYLPVTVQGKIRGGTVEVDPSHSSQFVSALMLVAPILDGGLRITFSKPPVSVSYIRMTANVLEQAGVLCRLDEKGVQIEPGPIRLPSIEIPVDATAASYLMMAGLLGPNPVAVLGYQYHPELHGECHFVDHVARLGGELMLQPNKVIARPVPDFVSAELDCTDCPDVVQSLAVLACFARGDVRLTGLDALPYKESNRIEDTARELSRCGVSVTTGSAWMKIGKADWRPCQFVTHQDHRMAMSLAQLSWRVKGLNMRDWQVVGKSWPEYWHVMAELGLPLAQKICNGGEN